MSVVVAFLSAFLLEQRFGPNRVCARCAVALMILKYLYINRFAITLDHFYFVICTLRQWSQDNL